MSSQYGGGGNGVKKYQFYVVTSPKGFWASKCDVGNWIFSNCLRNCWEFFFDFLGNFWEFFRRIFWGDFLGKFFWRIFLGGFFWRNFFGEIFWEEFFGKIFLGGFFWEEFFGRNYLIELMFLSRFWGNIFVSMQGRRRRKNFKP